MAVTVGATPGAVDLTGIRGDKWGPFEFTAQTEADLSGRTWVAQVRTTRDRPAEVIAEMVVDDSDSADGIIRVSILPAESVNLATGPDANPDFAEGKALYWWDVQATLDADPTDVKTWFGGKVKVVGDVAVDS